LPAEALATADAGKGRTASRCAWQMRIIDVVAPFGGEAEMRGQTSRV
jgi:hypothetical protein